jgi:XTP/dITP diphosphohydrolase
MRIVLASSNKGKIKEIKKYFGEEVVAFSDLIEPFEIIENGNSFKENAIIKAKTIQTKLPNDIIIADDSGISVPKLGGIPGIYSARFAGKNANDKDNLLKLIDELKKINIKKTEAFYTSAIAIASPYGVFTTHGFMYGNVIDEVKGDNGFGYSPFSQEGSAIIYARMEAPVFDTICGNDSTLWRGSYYQSSGRYKDSYGLDSAFFLDLEVHPSYLDKQEVDLCSGGTYSWKGTTYYLPGTYNIQHYTTEGCDSVERLVLHVRSDYTTKLSEHICMGDSLFFDGGFIKNQGNYRECARNGLPRLADDRRVQRLSGLSPTAAMLGSPGT